MFANHVDDYLNDVLPLGEQRRGGRNRIIAINTATKYDIGPAMNAHTPPTLTHTFSPSCKSWQKTAHKNYLRE